MHFIKTMFVMAGLATYVAISAAAVKPEQSAVGKFTNLKILPRDISSKDLNRIMVDELSDGLGVSCSFCHKTADNGQAPDYSSDENPEKQRARNMMRMTLSINRKFLKVKKPMLGDASMVVTCNTCHHGKAFPE